MYLHLIYFLNSGVMYVVSNFITSVYIFGLSVGVQTYKSTKIPTKIMYEFFKLLAHIVHIQLGIRDLLSSTYSIKMICK
jgi:hypothetical protein